MSIIDDLRKLSSAEEFFDALGVEHDPAVVSVARRHILRRMDEYLASTPLDAAPEAQAFEACKIQLAEAYADFVACTPIEQRLFKAQKDKVKPQTKPAKPFVPLDMLITPDSRPL